MGLIGKLIQNNILERMSSHPIFLGATLLGLGLTNVLSKFSEEGDFFESRTGERRIIDKSIVDPWTGETYSYTSQDELYQIREKIAESEANYKKEKLRADLLLASGGSPEQIESIYQSTSPVKKGKFLVEDSSSGYYQQMSNAVSDAVLASASTMTLDELRKFAAKYPGLHSTLLNREAQTQRAQIAISRLSSERTKLASQINELG